MKGYGQADVICAAVLFFPERHGKLTEEKKTENKKCSEAAEQYHAARYGELKL